MSIFLSYLVIRVWWDFYRLSIMNHVFTQVLHLWPGARNQTHPHKGPNLGNPMGLMNRFPRDHVTSKKQAFPRMLKMWTILELIDLICWTIQPLDFFSFPMLQNSYRTYGIFATHVRRVDFGTRDLHLDSTSLDPCLFHQAALKTQFHHIKSWIWIIIVVPWTNWILIKSCQCTETCSLYEQSRKPQIHRKDIHKFGKVPSLTTRSHKNDIWQTWGYDLQENLTIFLTPERRVCFLFDQASSLQDSELSEEVLLEEVLCKSLFPHLPGEGLWIWTLHHAELLASSAWTASLLASHLYTATL